VVEGEDKDVQKEAEKNDHVDSQRRSRGVRKAATMAVATDPGSAAKADRPVPVTVFTGFVGSGKTTMILRYVNRPLVTLCTRECR